MNYLTTLLLALSLTATATAANVHRRQRDPTTDAPITRTLDSPCFSTVTLPHGITLPTLPPCVVYPTPAPKAKREAVPQRDIEIGDGEVITRNPVVDPISTRSVGCLSTATLPKGITISPLPPCVVPYPTLAPKARREASPQRDIVIGDGDIITRTQVIDPISTRSVGCLSTATLPKGITISPLPPCVVPYPTPAPGGKMRRAAQREVVEDPVITRKPTVDPVITRTVGCLSTATLPKGVTISPLPPCVVPYPTPKN